MDRDVVDGFRSKRLLIEDEESMTKICYSQPELIENDIITSAFTTKECPNFSFSQPAHMEDLLLSTQLQTLPNTQTSQVLITILQLLKINIWSKQNGNAKNFPYKHKKFLTKSLFIKFLSKYFNI